MDEAQAPGSTIGASLDDLRLLVDELRASRARVVAAWDDALRTIERDLHDDVQQQLVALAVGVQLARQLADSDPGALGAALDELVRDIHTALESVRGLAARVYPSLLVDRGLVEALHGAAAAVGIPARVEAASLGRYPPDVEAAVYFCCVEALENAAGHAGAGARVVVRLWAEPHALCFEVADDGAGFDPQTTPPGDGLTSLRDRLGALDGLLTVSSDPGAGARVGGTIPLAS